MKNVLLTFLILATCSAVTLGQVYKITYKLTGKFHGGTYVLLADGQKSLYQPLYVLKKTETAPTAAQATEKPKVDPIAANGPGAQIDKILAQPTAAVIPYNKRRALLRDKQENILTSVEDNTDYRYTVQEELPVIDWKLSEKTKTVAGYLCRAATGDFRGRSYSVWYTEEIPVATGPWKLGGLPGAILYASASPKDAYVFEATGVEILPEVSAPSLAFGFAEPRLTYAQYQQKVDSLMQASVNSQYKAIQETLPKGEAMSVSPVKRFRRHIETNFEKPYLSQLEN